MSIVDCCPSTLFLSHIKWRERVYWDGSCIRKQIRGHVNDMSWKCHPKATPSLSRNSSPAWPTPLPSLANWWSLMDNHPKASWGKYSRSEPGSVWVSANRIQHVVPYYFANVYSPFWDSPQRDLSKLHRLEASGFIHGTNMTAITEYKKDIEIKLKLPHNITLVHQICQQLPPSGRLLPDSSLSAKVRLPSCPSTASSCIFADGQRC